MITLSESAVLLSKIPKFVSRKELKNILTVRKLLFFVLFLTLVFNANAKEGELFIHDHLFNNQEITAVTEWNDKIWVATASGLYRLQNRDYTAVSIPSAENDKITSLDNSSPFNLVCGTYRGKVIMVSESENDYCGQEWTMRPKNIPEDFFISATTQTNEGLWMATLEYGILLLNHKTKNATNFPLNFKEGLKGINAYNIVAGQKGETWVHSQNGLFHITRIFGPNEPLVYLLSRKVGSQVRFIAPSQNGVYVAYKKRKNLKLIEASFNTISYDLKVMERIKLPSYFSDNGLIALNGEKGKLWLLGKELFSIKDDVQESFKLPEEIEVSDVLCMLVKEGHVWIATKTNGIYQLGFEEKKIDDEEIVFNGEVVSTGKVLVLEKVFFEAGDSLLNSASYEQLSQLAYLLRAHPNSHIILKGHTALDGSPAYLYDLSKARAKAVKHFLVTKGISNSRIKVMAFGATQPKNPDDEKAPENRRVELIINLNK